MSMEGRIFTIFQSQVPAPYAKSAISEVQVCVVDKEDQGRGAIPGFGTQLPSLSALGIWGYGDPGITRLEEFLYLQPRSVSMAEKNLEVCKRPGRVCIESTFLRCQQEPPCWLLC